MHKSQRACFSTLLLGASVTFWTACSSQDDTGNGGRGAVGNNAGRPDGSAGTSGAGATLGAGGSADFGGVGGALGASGSGTTGSGGAGTGGGGSGGSGTGTEGASGAGTGGTSGAAGSLGNSGSSGTSAGSDGGPTAGCTPAPTGTFQTRTEQGGPNNAYTIIRPTTLGQGGFKHPPVAWGNGLGTQPPLYANSLSQLASNGFVVIANPGPGSDPQVVRQGLEWLIAQNTGSGTFAGQLAVNCAGTIGYSMGGGAAVGSGSHPAVKAIVSIHGLQDAAERASGPILLLTSEGDTFVTKAGFVVPCYNRSSRQPTFLASHAGGDHLDPIAGTTDMPPAIAWLRYWIYGDQSARDWFFGTSCRLCSWPDVRKKNHTW